MKSAVCTIIELDTSAIHTELTIFQFMEHVKLCWHGVIMAIDLVVKLILQASFSETNIYSSFLRHK